MIFGDFFSLSRLVFQMNELALLFVLAFGLVPVSLYSLENECTSRRYMTRMLKRLQSAIPHTIQSFAFVVFFCRYCRLHKLRSVGFPRSSGALARRVIESTRMLLNYDVKQFSVVYHRVAHERLVRSIIEGQSLSAGVDDKKRMEQTKHNGLSMSFSNSLQFFFEATEAIAINYVNLYFS